MRSVVEHRHRRGRRPHFFVMPPRLTLLAADIVSRYKRDIMLTRQELQGLMDELLVSSEKPRGTRRIDNWLLTNADLVAHVCVGARPPLR